MYLLFYRRIFVFLPVSVGQLLVCGHNIQIIHANTKCKAHFLLVLMVRFGRLSLNSHHKSKYLNGMHGNTHTHTHGMNASQMLAFDRKKNELLRYNQRFGCHGMLTLSDIRVLCNCKVCQRDLVKYYRQVNITLFQFWHRASIMAVAISV